MTFKTYLATGVAAAFLTACGAANEASTTDTAEPAPAETSLHPALVDVAAANYSLEKTHAFMTVKIGHNGGISQYRISLTDFDADLAFDPAAP